MDTEDRDLTEEEQQEIKKLLEAIPEEEFLEYEDELRRMRTYAREYAINTYGEPYDNLSDEEKSDCDDYGRQCV